MACHWLKRLRKYLIGTGVALAFNAAFVRAGDDDTAELRKLIEAQQKQIEAQQKQMQQLQQRLDTPAGSSEASEQGAAPAPGGKYVIDENSVKRIVADYLQENPGAGMPSGCSIGYNGGQGFYIRSLPNPTYANWQDEAAKVPFDLRIRGRIQSDYYYYGVSDNYNHLTKNLTYPTAKGIPQGGTNPTGIVGANSTGDFSQIEVKRLRLIFEGNAFDPDLRYHIQFDGGTRGLTAASGGSGLTGVSNGGTSRGGGQPSTADGNGIGIVDHSVRLLGCYVAYDWHPTWGSGAGCCNCDCPDDSSRYGPTVTGIFGKFKPLFAGEELGGSGFCQFVEFSNVQWMFDTDDDNYLTQIGVQVRADEDRFYMQSCMTNANESQTSALQDQRLPGLVGGFWYDFGGNWNPTRKAWDLYGEGVSDLYYSCCPVLRLGFDYAYLPGDRRTQYTNIDLGRIKVMPGGPGSTSLISLLNGAGNNGFAVDAFDTSELEFYATGKYRGFSFLADWFFRDITNIRGEKATGGNDAPILYTTNGPGSSTNVTALFRKGSLVDLGQQLQAGYFVIPRKLELCARWGYIYGESGSPNGDNKVIGKETVVTSTGPVTAVLYDKAFSKFQQSQSYEMGVNYFFRGQAVKWQTDLGYYTGGNPGGNGQSPAGFIPGVDGWLLRTQVTLFF